MSAFSPKSGRALIEQRALERRVRDLLIQSQGYHAPRIVRVEQEPDRLVALFVIETLGGEKAMTAFIEVDEVVVVQGFEF